MLYIHTHTHTHVPYTHTLTHTHKPGYPPIPSPSQDTLPYPHGLIPPTLSLLPYPHGLIPPTLSLTGYPPIPSWSHTPHLLPHRIPSHTLMVSYTLPSPSQDTLPDHLRTMIMREPRGHFDMYGALLVDSDLPEADLAVLFIHDEGRGRGHYEGRGGVIMRIGVWSL